MDTKKTCQLIPWPNMVMTRPLQNQVVQEMTVVCCFLVYMVEFVKEIGRDTDVNVRVVSMVTIVLKVNKTFGILSFSVLICTPVKRLDILQNTIVRSHTSFTGTCFIQKIYAPSSSLLQGKHLPFSFSPSPLRLNIFCLFVILLLTQLYRYTPEIFLFSTATFKYTYLICSTSNYWHLIFKAPFFKFSISI
jgi:hypothetical protein